MYQQLAFLDEFFRSGDTVVVATVSAFLFLTGAVIASLSCLIAFRLKTIRDDQSVLSAISYPPSHCDNCGRKLTLIELVPVFGWLATGGRCRSCGSRVAVRYPLLESLLGVCLAALPFIFGGLSEALPAIFVVCLAFMIAVIDWDNGMVPEELTWILLFAGLLFSPYEPDLLSRVVGAAVGAGLAWATVTVPGWLKGVDTRAWGDVAMVAGAGAWLGCWAVCWCCVLAAFIHLAICAANSSMRLRGEPGTEDDDLMVWTPLGPALAVSLVLMLCFVPVSTFY